MKFWIQYIVCCTLCFACVSANLPSPLLLDESPSVLENKSMKFDYFASDMYGCLNEQNLSYEAFYSGLKAYYSCLTKGKSSDHGILTVVDFSKSSKQERFFVIDIHNHTVLFSKHVSHGKNTGREYAKNFSNTPESRMSSLGTYVTGVTYEGKYDNSLKIHGLEFSNNKALERGVVIHAAKYATREFLNMNGMLGRSYGCPALPFEEYEQIVDFIKDGSVLFIYANESSYLRNSSYLKERSYLKSFF